MRKTEHSDNSRKQGDIGVADAIAFFTRNGYIVAIPLPESPDFDLIVVKDNRVERVQVKTSTYKARSRRKGKDGRAVFRGPEYYMVNIATCGGNKRTSIIKRLDPTRVELLYILTGDETRYLIPSQEVKVTKNLTLYPKYDKYKV